VAWATTWIGYFYILTFIIGFGAITNLIPNPFDYFVDGEIAKGLKGGGNMAAIHLSNAVGGNVFLGFISAVAFATILAVVAGLTLSGASAVSHDLYASVWRHGNVDSATELRVSKITTVVLGFVAIGLGIAFEKENVAYMVMLAFTIACSANFPVLFMSVLWKNCTTKGAVIGGSVGLISSVVLTIGSASVWEAVLKYPKGSAWFPYNSAALFSMSAAFFTIWLVSKLDNSAQAKKERALFADQHTRSETGVGASTASAH
jgi:cation/acetate symporter